MASVLGWKLYFAIARNRIPTLVNVPVYPKFNRTCAINPSSDIGNKKKFVPTHICIESFCIKWVYTKLMDIIVLNLNL